MPETLNLNDRTFTVLGLLAKGKGGYCCLAEDATGRYVLKQVHHEPCDYYTFGDKLASALRDYETLRTLDVPMPRLPEVDHRQERLLKEFIPGPTVAQMEQSLDPTLLVQVRDLSARLRDAGLNIDWYSTNFMVRNGLSTMARQMMPFEACIRVEELGDLATACEFVPETTVIVNRLGNCRDRITLHSLRYEWAMERLAACPNVYLKVDGFPTEDREFARELVGFAKKTFRADRVMYASNWPQIDGASLETHITLLGDVFGADPKFWRENAMRCYGITLREGRKAA